MLSLLHHHFVATVALMVLRSAAWLALATIVLAPLELFLPLRKEKLIYPDFWTDLGWFFVNTLLASVLLAPPLAAIAYIAREIEPSAIPAAAAALPVSVKMLLAMIVGEIGFYWGHRWCHEWPLLWRFHAIHHSAEHVGYLVNTRAHPLDMLFTRLCGVTLLIATGLAQPTKGGDDVVIAFVLIVGSLWSYFIHANVRLRLGFFEEILASPAFHHWHHSREDHKDHNYASMLPVMDRVFGTFHLPQAWPAAYGTATPTPPGLLGQLIAPFESRRLRRAAGVSSQPSSAKDGIPAKV